ncbi:MAG: hypothetical protein F6J93_02000 [Oscillatoria sp. SIO1A7]|nr:hypothetical protein [Oscillatoria sp. SIO1A7]
MRLPRTGTRSIASRGGRGLCIGRDLCVIAVSGQRSAVSLCADRRLRRAATSISFTSFGNSFELP